MATLTDEQAARVILTTAVQVLVDSHDELSLALVAEVSKVVDETREQELQLLRAIVGSPQIVFLMGDPSAALLFPMYMEWRKHYGVPPLSESE